MMIIISIVVLIFVLVIGICAVFNIDIIGLLVIFILFPLFYRDPDIVERKQPKKYIETDLVIYLRDYNPLNNYYESLHYTSADMQFINKIMYNSSMRIFIHDLSGIMLLKIYFKREQLTHILNADECEEIISYARNIYSLYVSFINKHPGVLFIPNMNKHEIVCKQYRLHMDPKIVLFNEMFYFNRYY